MSLEATSRQYRQRIAQLAQIVDGPEPAAEEEAGTVVAEAEETEVEVEETEAEVEAEESAE